MALILIKPRLFRKELSKIYVNNYSKFLNAKEYKKCLKILQIDEKCDQEEIRIAYIALVKKYHPDSGTEEANVEKFQEIDKAFKTVINQKSKERWNVLEEDEKKEQDIKHTTPQHRQYLNYEGFGTGNPFQREKQYAKIRASQAAENVYNHRISKLTVEENSLIDITKKPINHKIKTKYGFDRLVEDLIQESMSKGEFNNLKNSGKPLLDNNHNYNPYVDFVTHKLNQVLIENGFTPEWIRLQKEIRDEAQKLRKKLFSERQYFGAYPLSVEENIEWSECVYKKFKSVVERINKKITKFNLVVPILDKQMLQICLEKEAQKAMIMGTCYKDLRFDDKNTKLIDKKKSSNNNNNNIFFELLKYFFKK